MTDRWLALRLWLSVALKPAPLLFVCQLLLAGAAQSLAPLASFYGAKLVIDGFGGDDRALVWNGTFLALTGLALTLVTMVVLAPIEGTVNDKVHVHVYRELMSLVSRIPDIAHHENPKLADRVAYLSGQVRDMSYITTALVGTILAVVNVVAMVGLLVSVRPEFLLLPLLGLLRIWSGNRAGRWQQEARQQVASHRRRRDRLKELATATGHGVEIRTSGLSRFLPERHHALLSAERHETLQASRRGLLVEMTARLLFGLGYGAAIVYTVVLVRNGTALPGDIALIVLLATRVDENAGMVAGTVSGIARTWRLFKTFAEFVDYSSQRVAAGTGEPAPDRLRDGITLSGVGFAYPQGESPALQDVDLRLPAGSTVALVGENGAGKTTLVKLLLRLYNPTSGQISVDAADLSTVDVTGWRNRVSAGFQDFDRFEFTAGETVGVGDLGHREHLDQALDRGDATSVIAGLKVGLDTQLGSSWNDGVDLSGGQWQRLALARAFMPTEPLLLVLDEPTAALDPEAEHALFLRFADASQRSVAGGITLLVSHRFSTVRMADLIVVMQGGRIIETGTHAELMAAAGHYAELFSLQAKAYT